MPGMLCWWRWGGGARWTGLDLESAGVAHGPLGVTVGDKLRTSQRHIYAAGDCTGGPQFSHYAGFQGFIAARNAFSAGSGTGGAERSALGDFHRP